MGNGIRRSCALALLVVGIAAGGCRRPDEGEPSPGGVSGSAAGAPSASARQEAVQIFEMRCTPCHGPRGGGDGPASAGLTPRPRNLGDGAWQESVSDEHIASIIKMGGVAVGKSPAMPANPDLMAKDDVVAALVAHVRTLRR